MTGSTTTAASGKKAAGPGAVVRRHGMFGASPLNAGAHAETNRAVLAFNDAREEAWYRVTYENGGGGGGSGDELRAEDGGWDDDVNDPLRGSTSSSGAKYIACWGCGKEGPPLKLCRRCLGATYCSKCVFFIFSSPTKNRLGGWLQSIVTGQACVYSQRQLAHASRPARLASRRARTRADGEGDPPPLTKYFSH